MWMLLSLSSHAKATTFVPHYKQKHKISTQMDLVRDKFSVVPFHHIIFYLMSAK
jgi:hypothetical protein